MMISARQRRTIETTMCWLVLVAVVCVAPLGCSRQGAKGVLEVQVKDHREAIGDFASAKIVVASIRVSPDVGFKFWQLGWINLNPGLDSVDLTQFVGRTAATIFKGNIDAGSYEALDLKLRGVNGILKKDSTPVSINNKLVPVAISFDATAGAVTKIILDLSVMDMSDHPPEAYELQLVGYEVYQNGKLINKIPPG